MYVLKRGGGGVEGTDWRLYKGNGETQFSLWKSRLKCYRPCSAYDKGAMNFLLRHPNWAKLAIKNKEALLKGQCHEIFCFRLFPWITFPQAPDTVITLGSFWIFSKIRGDIRKSRCTTGVNDKGGKLLPVSTTPAANFPPVSTTPAANFATSSPCAVDTGGK